MAGFQPDVLSKQPIAGLGPSFEGLMQIMLRLQQPDGCPWDLEQTVESLFPYLLEEVWEAFETRNQADLRMLKKELGDVFYTVLFMIVIINRESSVPNVESMLNFMRLKMISRHPHVFGEEKAKNVTEAYKHWHASKRKEGMPAEDQRLKALRKVLHSIFIELEKHPARFSALEKTVNDWIEDA